MDHVEITKTEDISEGNMKAFIVSGKDILVSEYQGKYIQ
jgi:nitrite reductase/ring-hydroxylating ferredoxin subunit